jgi:glutamate dehydrogenase
LARAVVSVWQVLAQRKPGIGNVRIISPPYDEGDARSAHTVVEVDTDDMPFLVDSVRMALQRNGLAVDLIAHSVIGLQRDAAGKFLKFAHADEGGCDEAVMYIEVERCTESEAVERLRQDVLNTLDDVRAAVLDWPQIKAKVRDILHELDAGPLPVGAEEIEESKAFLQWIDDHHFTFLGYRYYELAQENGDDVLRFMPGSSLGTAPPASSPAASQTFIALPPEHRAAFREPKLLILTKANVRATVHRPSYMDYIGVKRFNAKGGVVGEHRILGLFTSAAYNRNPRDIPLLRRKVTALVERAGFRPFSHNGKAFLNILETYPRDELFQISEDELFDNSMAILQLQERRRVRLIVRREAFGRFVSCIVFVPRDRFDTSVRERIQKILLHAFNGESVDFTVHVSESVLARCYLIIHTPPGSPFECDPAQLESELAATARTWSDELQSVLIQSRGEEAGAKHFRRYHGAFPVAYRDEFTPGAAVRDIEDIEKALTADRPVLALYRPLGAPSDQLRFKMFAGGDPVTLSDLLPVLENMGVRVLRERPFEIKPEGCNCVWIYDFILNQDADKELAVDSIKALFEDCFAAVWDGLAENDAYNKLALRARLNWREISVLRAYARYLRQIGTTFSQSYMQQVLAGSAAIARLLIELFHARFDCARLENADTRSGALTAKLNETLDAVESLDEDRILRNFLTVIQATTRTNFYQFDSRKYPKAYLVLKLNPALIPDIPLPRPIFEIFVYSPRVEAIHLRGGLVARGGLRWSDRREDFRTEVLGLMKAQMVKNAIIVPVGAKGGFVVKRPPESTDRDAMRDEVVYCYRTFIRGMLDVTDNIVDGKAVAPKQVARYDGDDPYLVVAADKGTATFSDTANDIAKEYDFWLSDAFASGGAHGYDHKKMGITARGAWESVKRHFRELGVDTQATPFTVVGIGDMSGDVFGNGMLLSPHIKLIAAFDHRHIFLDPNPDPQRSFEERKRIFNLPRSTWADYDAKAISQGGGVHSRKVKSVKLSAPVKQALGLGADALAPDNLIRAILKAPVDLMWNGGIGTYVKASVESHADAGDRSNDTVRIDAAELRCRVLGEGGNLGVTQKGRIEFALHGGLINTDFIDNAGGVHCSDQEVNIKILLNACVARGQTDERERNELLEAMTDEVAEHVIRENYWQSGSISLMRHQAVVLVDEQLRFMKSLEREGTLDRRLEYLPDDETIAERRAAGQGLTRPELAVLITYAKNTVFQQLLTGDAPEDAYLSRELARYFPSLLRERFRTDLQRHRLRRELIATYVTNRLVNRMGATFVFRLQEEQGANVAQIARAYTSIWEIFQLRDLMTAIAGLDNLAPVHVQSRMIIAVVRLIERGTLWLLRREPGAIDISASIDRYQTGVGNVASFMAKLLSVDQMQALTADAVPLIEAGAPEDLAHQVARLEYLYSALDVIDIADETGAAVNRAAGMYFALDAQLELSWLRDQIAGLPADDRWGGRARTALDDEVCANLRTITAMVLRSDPESENSQHALQHWSAHTDGAVERYLRTLAEFRVSTKIDIAMLSVAVKQIQDLTRRAAPSES